MTKIVCAIPGAPLEIGGLAGIVKFEQRSDGLLAADVSDDEAEHFLSIKGYSLDTGKAVATMKNADPTEAEVAAEAARKAAEAEAAAIEAMRQRAAAAGLEVDNRWKIARLTSEVERAEALAAEAKKAAETTGGETPAT